MCLQIEEGIFINDSIIKSNALQKILMSKHNFTNFVKLINWKTQYLLIIIIVLACGLMPKALRPVNTTIFTIKKNFKRLKYLSLKDI